MSKTTCFFLALVLTLAFVSAIALADVDQDKAMKIAKDNLKELIDQSYHHRVEYDTVFVLPVHSKTIRKGDFYLVYFLEADMFRAEVEVDKATGKATLLAINKMMPPYHDLPGGRFNHRYFCIDSVLFHGFRRERLEQDSARLVYFGVNPRLGKRGVIWELFSADGPSYLSLGAGSISLKNIIYGLNTAYRGDRNYAADSIQLRELIDEVERLEGLEESEIKELNLNDQSHGDLIKLYRAEIDTIYRNFPDLRKKVPLPDQAEAIKNKGK